MLSSVAIEAAESLLPQPTVLYFYCKSGDPQRDNFNAILRGLLSQLRLQQPDVVEFLFSEASKSPDVVLTSNKLACGILETCLKNSQLVYVVLDGIDECATRAERSSICTWFREIVENLPAAAPDTIRCMFVSQDDGFARKDFAGLTTIEMQPHHAWHDIGTFCERGMQRLQQKFGVSASQALRMASAVTTAADGTGRSVDESAVLT